ncbi:MAG: tetratricopeptide repeat protein [Planctomycetes bacterium]|nr:tetratricopeptide repeat protein [Planctomycetota bacterium]
MAEYKQPSKPIEPTGIGKDGTWDQISSSPPVAGQGWYKILQVNKFIPALALLGLCLLVYYPLHAAGFIWDDGYWILNNPALHNWRGLGIIWFEPQAFMQYYPLTVTAFFLQWRLWGANALGFHIVSVLLQVGNAIILWRILVRLRLRAAWVAAAIFAINPVAVESVAWVVEQKNLISGMLVLAAVWSWIRFAGLDRPAAQIESQPAVYRGKYYAIATAFYFLAVCAKTFVCALPAAILVLTWWKLGRLTRRHIFASIPWFIITSGAAWMATWRERNGAMAKGKAYHFTIFQHLVIAGKDLWFYVGKLLWPHPILMVYPRWHVQAFKPADLLFPITAALLAALCWVWRKRIGRGVFAALAIYAIMVSPSLGFVAFAGMAITFVADHYFYLGCMSLIVLLVEMGFVVVSKLLSGLKLTDAAQLKPAATSESGVESTAQAKLPIAVATGVLALLGVVSSVQCMYYVPPIEIWLHELRYDKQCYKAYEVLAYHAKDHHHFHQEFTCCQDALKITKGTDPTANYLLGSLYLQQHNYPQAMYYFRKTLMLDSYQAKAIVKLAYCYQQRGNWVMAMKDIKRGLALMPKSSRLYLAFGLAQTHQGNMELARKAYLDAIACNHRNADAYYNLGILLDQQGHWRQAMERYRAALTINPGLAKAHFFYGLDLLKHGYPKAAVKQFRTVIAQRPDHPSVYHFLSQALRAAGHPRQAALAQTLQNKK